MLLFCTNNDLHDESLLICLLHVFASSVARSDIAYFVSVAGNAKLRFTSREEECSISTERVAPVQYVRGDWPVNDSWTGPYQNKEKVASKGEQALLRFGAWTSPEQGEGGKQVVVSTFAIFLLAWALPQQRADSKQVVISTFVILRLGLTGERSRL